MMKCLTILLVTSLALPLPAGAAGSNLSKKSKSKEFGLSAKNPGQKKSRSYCSTIGDCNHLISTCIAINGTWTETSTGPKGQPRAGFCRHTDWN